MVRHRAAQVAIGEVSQPRAAGAAAISSKAVLGQCPSRRCARWPSRCYDDFAIVKTDERTTGHHRNERWPRNRRGDRETGGCARPFGVSTFFITAKPPRMWSASSQPGTGRRLRFKLTLAQEADVVALFREVDSRLGRLAALVNNAATLERQMWLDSMEIARIERIFAINVIGSMVCAREAVKRMSVRHGGSGGAIVNISSGAAKYGSPREYVDYAASKGAVETFTIGLASEVAEGGARWQGRRELRSISR